MVRAAIARERVQNGGTMATEGITLDAWNACARQSDMARLLGVAGKTFRDTTRRVFGTYVSHGDALDERVRAFLFAYHVTYAGNADARIAVRKSFADGAKVPPVIK